MKEQNKITRLLKDTSGASFMFVLGIMLLLMAIGVSTLVAASANSGFMIRQKEHSQVMLLNDSIHRNIMYSLQHDTEDPNLLSRQLVMAIYDAYNDALKKEPLEEEIELDIGITGSATGFDLNGGNMKVKSIKLYFPRKVEEMVLVTEGVAGIADISPPVARIPEIATINAEMIVTVEVEVAAQKRTVISRATYRYAGGVLSDEVTEGTMAFAVDEYGDTMSGEWELIKYESVDS